MRRRQVVVSGWIIGAALTCGLGFEGVRPVPAQAQVIPALLGGAGGLVAGAYVTTGVYIAKARAGRFIYSTEEVARVGPELLPVLLLPVSGVVLGAVDGDRLATAGIGAGLGFVGGALLGTGIGHVAWGRSEGRWSGAVIGSAAGLVIGGVLGAFLHSDDEDEALGPTPLLTVALPVPWRFE